MTSAKNGTLPESKSVRDSWYEFHTIVDLCTHACVQEAKHPSAPYHTCYGSLVYGSFHESACKPLEVPRLDRSASLASGVQLVFCECCAVICRAAAAAGTNRCSVVFTDAHAGLSRGAPRDRFPERGKLSAGSMLDSPRPRSVITSTSNFQGRAVQCPIE